MFCIGRVIKQLITVYWKREQKWLIRHTLHKSHWSKSHIYMYCIGQIIKELITVYRVDFALIK